MTVITFNVLAKQLKLGRITGNVKSLKVIVEKKKDTYIPNVYSQ